MNFKFFLTIALSFGCVIMLFMWYSTNGIYKDSLLYQKQFLFKISTLESENKMELKLINSLRVDVAKNDEDLKVKTNLLESMRNKEKSRDEEKEKLKKDIEVVKHNYDKVNKENDNWLENWKVESQNKSDTFKIKIKQLDDELLSLNNEYDRLKRSLLTTRVNTVTTKLITKAVSLIKNVNIKKDNHALVKQAQIETKDSEARDRKADKDDNKPNDAKKLNADEPSLQGKAPNINKKIAEPSNDAKKFHGDDHQMQAKAPNINKKIGESSDVKLKKSLNDNQQRHLKGLIFKNNKTHDNDETKNKHKIIENAKPADANQLKQPNLSMSDDQSGHNKEIKRFLEDKDDILSSNRNRNPKILKKDFNPQVKPPVAVKKINPSVKSEESNLHDKKSSKNKVHDSNEKL